MTDLIRKRSRGQASARKASVVAGGAGLNDLGAGSVVEYYPRHFLQEKTFLQELQQHVCWKRLNIRVMGRVVQQPRMVAYMADSPALVYKYSGLALAPTAWHSTVLSVKTSLEQRFGCTFNSCLLNMYVTGQDYVSYHSDNEPLYGSNPTIASVSLGGSREFVLRQNDDHSHKLQFNLGHGDVLVMKGTTQDNWMHTVPKRAKIEGLRINLTFRNVCGLLEQKTTGQAVA